MLIPRTNTVDMYSIHHGTAPLVVINKVANSQTITAEPEGAMLELSLHRCYQKSSLKVTDAWQTSGLQCNTYGSKACTSMDVLLYALCWLAMPPSCDALYLK